MKKNKSKYLSILMVILILLQVILPTTVFADTSDSIPASNALGDISVSEPTRGAEITAMREKNAKTYEMSDGTYQCVVYAEDIHYEDSRGTLQDIDNSIKNTTTKSGYSLTNTANSWHTYFADKLSQNKAVSLEKDNYSISFSLPTSTVSSGSGALREPLAAIGTSTSSNVKIATQLSAAEKAVSPYYSNLAEDNRAVLYKDVLNNVDISYTVKTGHLKEDIIIKSAAAPTEFEFKLNMVGVTPEQVDGKLVFNNTEGETIFELAPMYMEDANGKYSEAITYSIEEDTDGYKLTVTADPNFFLDSKTVYPVIIDPSVMVTGESNTYDTCVDEQYPTNNYYSRENLWTGGKTGTNRMLSYIQFVLPKDIVPHRVTAAYLRIKKREHETPSIKAYRIIKTWQANTVTWNNPAKYTETSPSGAAVLDSGSWYKLDVSQMVKNWMNGTYNNYGFCLMEPTDTNSSLKTKFYSSDAPSPNKPELVINYTSPSVTASYDYEVYKNSASSLSVTKMKEYMDIAEEAFLDGFGVDFNRITTGSSASLNQKSGCENSGICDGNCATVSTCKTSHHKASYYLCTKLQNSTRKVFRIVDFNICNYKDNDHHEVYGLALSDDKNMVVTLKSNNVQKIIVHEISHLIGANDDECTSGQLCVMKGSTSRYNVWCTNCKNDINAYLN